MGIRALSGIIEALKSLLQRKICPFVCGNERRA
jgi:hypothetical protein